jgi:hypothetical protein
MNDEIASQSTVPLHSPRAPRVMSSKAILKALFRWVWPLILLAAACVRVNFLAFGYLLLFIGHAISYYHGHHHLRHTIALLATIYSCGIMLAQIINLLAFQSQGALAHAFGFDPASSAIDIVLIFAPHIVVFLCGLAIYCGTIFRGKLIHAIWRANHLAVLATMVYALLFLTAVFDCALISLPYFLFISLEGLLGATPISSLRLRTKYVA